MAAQLGHNINNSDDNDDDDDDDDTETNLAAKLRKRVLEMLLIWEVRVSDLGR
jgi:hypothetical protein